MRHHGPGGGLNGATGEGQTGGAIGGIHVYRLPDLALAIGQHDAVREEPGLGGVIFSPLPHLGQDVSRSNSGIMDPSTMPQRSSSGSQLGPPRSG